MYCHINPPEVLKYLSELGYQNISPYQLKEFMKDLKKLIKYDQRMQERNYSENLDCPSYQRIDVTPLYKAHAPLFTVEEASMKEKIINVQMKKPSVKGCLEKRECSSKVNESINLSNSNNSVSSCNNKHIKIIENNQYSIKHKHDCKNVEKINSQNINLKPKSSFIRPKSDIKHCKSDPVTLYHRYQAEWKTQKIPGKNKHANLRWIIREKMLGE